MKIFDGYPRCSGKSTAHLYEILYSVENKTKAGFAYPTKEVMKQKEKDFYVKFKKKIKFSLIKKSKCVYSVAYC